MLSIWAALVTTVLYPNATIPWSNIEHAAGPPDDDGLYAKCELAPLTSTDPLIFHYLPHQWTGKNAPQEMVFAAHMQAHPGCGVAATLMNGTTQVLTVVGTLTGDKQQLVEFDPPDPYWGMGQSAFLFALENGTLTVILCVNSDAEYRTVKVWDGMMEVE